MDDLREMDQTLVRESEFATKKITPLYWKYALLALLGLLLQTASVIADGIFVGNGVGPLGLATIGIIAPLWTINVAFFNLFGMGGATIAVIKRGEGDEEGARKIYGTIIIFSFIFSAVLSLLALLSLENVLVFLGAIPEIIPSAKEYAIPYLLGAPICVAGSVATYFARADEKPLAAALAYALPAVAAIVLQYILIMKMGMGMMGSSIPWIVCVGGSIVLIPYLQKKSNLFKIKASDIKIQFSIVIKTVKVGFAFFAVPICTTIATILINNLIVKYGGGELEIAGFGIINAYIAYVIMVIALALVAGLQPIASYNIGAKAYDRVAKLLKVTSIQITLVVIVLVILVLANGEKVIGIFAGTDPVFIVATYDILKIYLLLYAIGNISQIAAAYFSSRKKWACNIKWDRKNNYICSTISNLVTNNVWVRRNLDGATCC